MYEATQESIVDVYEKEYAGINLHSVFVDDPLALTNM